MEKYVHPIFSYSGCWAWREKRIELLRVPGRRPRGGAVQRGCVRGGGRGRLLAVPFCRLLSSWNCLGITHSFQQTVTSCLLVWERGGMEVGATAVTVSWGQGTDEWQAVAGI